MTKDIQCITPANASLLSAVAGMWLDEDITPDRLGAFLAAEGHVMFVAVEAGQVVGQIRGMMHVQPDRASDLYIDNLGGAEPQAPPDREPAHRRLDGLGRGAGAAPASGLRPNQTMTKGWASTAP